MQMLPVDFSFDKELFSNLDGAAQKTVVMHDGKPHIIKYGSQLAPKKNAPDQGSYQHAPICEHIGCRVMDALGIPVQNTLLGTKDGREVVACENFLPSFGSDVELVPFSHIEGTIIDSSERGKTPHIENIRRVFAEHPAFEGIRQEASDRYWETFIADAIIGNPDRHGGNWGYVAARDKQTGFPSHIIGLAPVYDCGSSLSARLSETAMARIAASPEELRERACGWPSPALLVNGSKPGYVDFILSSEGTEARSALVRLAPAIAALNIESLIDGIPGISDVRRSFYKATLQSRIEYIVKPAYELAFAENDTKTVND